MPRPSSSICVAKTAVTASLLAPVYAKEERLVEVELALPTGWGPGLPCGGRVPCGGVKVRELVQTVDIGLGAGFDDIGGSATPHDLAASFFELHGDLSQGFGAAGYPMNLIPLELGGGVRDLRNGPATRVHGTVSNGGAFLRGALHAHSHRRGVISSRRRHTRLVSDWSSDVCSSDLSAGRRQGPEPRCDAPAPWRRGSACCR